MYQICIDSHNIVIFVFASCDNFRPGKTLSSHFVYTIRCIVLDALKIRSHNNYAILLADATVGHRKT